MKSILLARRSRVPVAIGRDRPGGRAAADQCRLRRHRERRWTAALCACSATAKSSSSTATAASAMGCLLPAGPLRETPARLRRADAIVVNGGRCASSTARCSMRLQATSAVAMKYGTAKPLRRVCRPAGARHRRHRQSAAFFQHAARASASKSSNIRCRTMRSCRIDDISFADELAGAHDREGCRKMPRYRRAASLVCSGQRSFRRRAMPKVLRGIVAEVIEDARARA